MLYFKEAGNIKLIYSEMSGVDNTMSKTGEGQYILTNNKNKKQNKYWYRNGILERALINHSVIDIEIKRIS